MPSADGKDVPNYKLTYFAVRGIGEPIRLLFHYAAVPFEDVRIKIMTEEPEPWAALKPKTPYGVLPMLEWDECAGDRCVHKVLAESQTIARFLAKKFGLAGKTDWESAKADEIAEWLKDIWRDMVPYIMVKHGRKEGDKEKMYDEVYVPIIKHRFIPVLLRELKGSGSGFLIPSGITWVDFFMVCSVSAFKQLDNGNLFGQHKELEEYEKRVYSANESIKKYLEERPKTDF